MDTEARLQNLRIALWVVGGLFVVGLPALMLWIWPEGWTWTPIQPEYEHMMLGVYATLGVFLILAARDPLAHRSLIWFTIWSSLVHGGIMLVAALKDPTDRINLLGDVPALFAIALVLWMLMPRRPAGP